MATINQMVNTNTLYTSSLTWNGSNSNFLGNYYSLKNGSYKKLLNAYYKNVANDSSSISTSDDSTSTTATIKKDATDLKNSLETLTARGNKSIFRKNAVESTDASGNKVYTDEYDKDRIYKAVKSFVDNYNSTLDSTVESDNKSILRSSLSMVRATKSNSQMLKDVGIYVGSDNKLSINEETFKNADMSKVKSLFNSASCYADTISAKASKIITTANFDSIKSNTYTGKGSYSYNYNSGNIYSSYF